MKASQININMTYDVSLFDGRHKQIKLEKAMHVSLPNSDVKDIASHRAGNGHVPKAFLGNNHACN